MRRLWRISHDHLLDVKALVALDMKRILLIRFVCLPSLALANSITFDTKEGILTGSNSGLVDRTSEVINATGFKGDLSKIFFSTSKLISGSLKDGGTFAAGGSFTLFGNGFDHTHRGVDFSGSFSGPLTWRLVTLSNGTHDYTLTGKLSGTSFTGQSVVGALSQTTLAILAKEPDSELYIGAISVVPKRPLPHLGRELPLLIVMALAGSIALQEKVK